MENMGGNNRTRNLPGSVVDSVLNNVQPNLSPRNGASVYYDPVNNVTVATGRNGVVSAHGGEFK